MTRSLSLALSAGLILDLLRRGQPRISPEAGGKLVFDREGGMMVGPAAAEEGAWRLGVLTPRSSVPMVMVPELAAFEADHDRRT
jgi:ferric-dicitrate binding protein FerR (iron transport regulator)